MPINKPRRVKPTSGPAFFTLEGKAWDELTALWDGLPENVLTQPGACGDWSIKIVMNHIAAWMEATIHVMPDLLEGRKLPAGEFTIEKFNARQSAADRDRSLPATRLRLEHARGELLVALHALPEDRLLNLRDRVGLWAKYATYGHYDEHLYDLQDFRKNAGK